MNDVIRLAMERAAARFGGADGMFNGAGFSSALMRLANLSGVIDGQLVRTMLTGRSDVIPLGGGHYRMVTP